MLDSVVTRGLSSFDDNICTEVSMRSALPNKKKSAGILFCVTLTVGGVGGAA